MGGKNYSDDLKMAVVRARNTGMSWGNISRTMGIPPSSARSICENYSKRNSVKNLTKPGGPRKTSKITDRKIVLEAKKNPRLTKR